MSSLPLGPIISSDIFAGLVQTTMLLDLDDLIEPAIPQTFRPHSSHQFDNTGEGGAELYSSTC
ncbi:MAG: hypothetical protein KME40_23615 [Komarekiella atlantica HA4396-MV6]|jgi:hypothetical protein|nr:hypothetical protein [Komarekiella atlantica HA4396-MV6]